MMCSNLLIQSTLEEMRHAIRCHVVDRSFNVISMRTHGQAVFASDDRKCSIDPKNLLIIPKGIEYWQETTGETILAIHIDGNIPYTKLTPVLCNRMERELFLNIFELYNQGTLYSQCMAHSKLYELFAELLGREEQMHQRDLISQGYDMLRARFRDPSLRIEAIADHLHISNVYLRREFRKRYGMTQKEYLIELRLEYAAELLQNDRCNVNETTYRSGFSSPSYFSVAFKSRYGISPSAYSKTPSAARLRSMQIGNTCLTAFE